MCRRTSDTPGRVRSSVLSPPMSRLDLCDQLASQDQRGHPQRAAACVVYGVGSTTPARSPAPAARSAATFDIACGPAPTTVCRISGLSSHRRPRGYDRVGTMARCSNEGSGRRSAAPPRVRWGLEEVRTRVERADPRPAGARRAATPRNRAGELRHAARAPLSGTRIIRTYVGIAHRWSAGSSACCSARETRSPPPTRVCWALRLSHLAGGTLPRSERVCSQLRDPSRWPTSGTTAATSTHSPISRWCPMTQPRAAVQGFRWPKLRGPGCLARPPCVCRRRVDAARDRRHRITTGQPRVVGMSWVLADGR